MPKPYHLVVFDWEGTLGEDSFSCVVSHLSDAAQRLHLGFVDTVVARQMAPLGLATVVKKLFPEASLYQQEELLSEIQKALTAPINKGRLVPDAFETVQWLHTMGMHLGIATNKSHLGLVRALQGSGLDAYFQVTRSADQVPAKPCPQMLEEIMAVFAVDATQTLMVGDSISDMEMAAAIGVDAIGLDRFGTEVADLRAAGAMQVFENYQQLLEYFKGGYT